MNNLTVTHLIFFILGFLICILTRKIKQYFKKPKIISEQKYEQTDNPNIDLIKEEWKTTIETQMHFNDLILKFRSTVLSIFITAVGIIYGLAKNDFIEESTSMAIFSLAAVFWVCSFIIDKYYYQKLLIGAVNHAKKFDQLKDFQYSGYLSLTNTINSHISSLKTDALIWIFYLFPCITAFIIVLIFYS